MVQKEVITTSKRVVATSALTKESFSLLKEKTEEVGGMNIEHRTGNIEC